MGSPGEWKSLLCIIIGPRLSLVPTEQAIHSYLVSSQMVLLYYKAINQDTEGGVEDTEGVHTCSLFFPKVPQVYHPTLLPLGFYYSNPAQLFRLLLSISTRGRALKNIPFLSQQVWDGARGLAFLSSSQRASMLLHQIIHYAIT
jgi:hypothetical protein